MSSTLTRRGATLMLLLVTLLWGGGFVTSQQALDLELPPSFILVCRFSLGAGVILLAFFRRIRRTNLQILVHGIGAGVLLFLGFYTQILGQARTTVPNAAFLTSTNVLMVPFLVWLFARKRPRTRIFLLCLVTMAGIVCLTLDGELRLSPTPGDGLVLLCAFFYALHIVYLDLVCSHDDSVPIAFWQLLICGMLSGLFMILGREQVPSDLLPAAPSLLYLGIFATGVCYLMQTRAQTVLSAPQAGIVMSMEGFFGSLLSLLFGQAAFRPLMALGGLLVTGSVLLSSLPEKSLSASEKTPDRSDA